jgi:hypothetical protein
MTDDDTEMALGRTSLETICGRKLCEAGPENARAQPKITRIA